MLHIYCGEGKGKTTCAMGLAARVAGHGHKVVIAQFLKRGNSGERVTFDEVTNITCLPVPEVTKFVFAMTEEEKAELRQKMERLFDQAIQLADCGRLLVLDELNGAIATGMISLKRVLAFLDTAPEALEVVITGRDPAPELMERADYVTEMRKIKHPFDQGVGARESIEW